MKSYKCTVHLEVIWHAVHLAAVIQELAQIFSKVNEDIV